MKKILLFPILLLMLSTASKAVTAGFTANVNNACSAPLTVTFNNLSTSADSYYWDFGDNSNDTAMNPVHIYVNAGLFTVKLYAYDLSGGIDSLVMVDFINIDPTLTCANLVTTNQNTAQTACNGILYDNGGPTGNYTSGSTRRTISPTGATSVSITFKKFNLEALNDSVEIYDGANITVNTPKIGTYYGNTLPNSGLPISSTTGSMTIRLRANNSIVNSGFEAIWQCTQAVTPPPVVNFNSNDTNSCLSVIKFFDQSTNTPTNWLWDFGDGTTSVLKNPSHVYANNGTYAVTLIASNSFGSDTLTKINYISVNRPSLATTGISGSTCTFGQVLLGATPANVGDSLVWYATDTSTIALGAGAQFVTPSISTPTNFYVEELVPGGATTSVGKIDSISGTAGGYSATSRFMIFNSSAPCTIQSVKVYADTAGNRTFQLRNAAGTILDSVTVFVSVGTQTISLNFNCPAGNGLRLGVTGNLIRLFRNLGLPANSYPYVGGPITITGNSANTNTAYYYIYDWQVDYTVYCHSLRTAVLANTGGITAFAFNSGSNTICSGDTAKLQAVIGTGYSYSWMESGSPIIGATNASYNATNSGSYTCSISAPGCSSVTTAPPIVINQITAPTSAIINQTNDTAYRCQGVLYPLIAAQGTGYTYQWLRNGQPVSTNDTLNILTGGGLAIGTYLLVTTGPGCSAGDTSAAFTLYTYNAPIAIISPFSTQELCSANSSISFTANTGTNYTYQWLLNGSPILGSNSSAYTANAVGAYSVIENNGVCPADTSNIVQIQNSTIAASFTYNASAGQTISFTNTSVGAITYSWNFGDGSPLVSQQNPTHTYTDTLVHTVTLIATSIGGCVDTILQTIDVHPSGINDLLDENAFSVFPVPSKDNIILKINPMVTNHQTYKIEIVNSLGMVVKSEQLISSNETISISELSKGVYFLRVYIDNNRVTKKIIRN